ncbi:MAG: DUF4124 domain-containing protein [Shewanella sp.]|nr:DUF4124 domain-containing protein [Shewanella sp.]MCF1431307.1 DUF4124 domain-containing protein [Shewanella sp.]MCF1437379.1 DUF4124 domain-containing protein [Shewanella sp.]MCF1457661.1 DUF4124 domain-containing protein [Shewanella sp.]
MKILLLTVALLSLPLQAEVYRWVDEQGVVHYSDTPIEGAVIIELNENTHNKMVLPTLQGSAQEQTDAVNYEVLITEPEQQATIRDNNGDFKVVASVSPQPPKGTRYQLLLDGQDWGSAQAQPLFQLTGIDRGEHTLSIKVYNPAGKLLTTTPERIIYLHQAFTRPTFRPQPRS